MRALIVSYSFPPVGGAGVQRVSKLVKYLPAYGVTPAVLTVKNPSAPLADHSLDSDAPPGLEVLRALTLEPGYRAKELAWQAAANDTDHFSARLRKQMVLFGKGLLVPDSQVLWLPFAGGALLARLFDRADDVVLISGPPFSQFLLAFVARLLPNTAVVLDYRDEWATTRTIYEMGGSARAGAALERAVLARAHAVVTATDAFRDELLRRFDFLNAADVVTIPNGYDPDDFPEAPRGPSGDRFVLTYVGTVFRLTSARPFLEAVRALHATHPELARLLEVRFIGRVVETEAAAFDGMEALGVHRLGYVEHEHALEELAASHAVLCLLDDVPGAERIYPGKIFELLYLGRPCLTIAPEGALAGLARDYELGPVVSPRDTESIARTLAGWLQAFRDGKWVTCARDDSTGRRAGKKRFHRRRLAGEFARVFEHAVARARRQMPQSVRSISAAK